MEDSWSIGKAVHVLITIGDRHSRIGIYRSQKCGVALRRSNSHGRQGIEQTTVISVPLAFMRIRIDDFIRSDVQARLKSARARRARTDIG